MHTAVDTIVKNLFRKESLHELAESEVEDYILRHPYASLGYLILAKKQKLEGKDFKKAAGAAALYVSNPLWLHNFLNEESRDFEIKPQLVNLAPSDVISNAETVSTDAYPQPVISAAAIETVPEPVIEKAVVIEIDSSDNPDKEGKLDELQQTHPAPAPTDDPIVSETVKDEEGLAFEPYHTIDYFASQGIKLTAEDLSKDKFGRQLRSFTEWLRSMKRIAPVQAADTPSQVIDETIQKTAEASVTNNDVETEAMAEVWAKQGKTAKAIDIYRKLSLLNPSKSHYFAAKIEQLNA